MQVVLVLATQWRAVFLAGPEVWQLSRGSDE